MKARTRVGMLLLGLLAPVGGMTYADPSWPEALGVDFWNMPHVESLEETERRRGAELDAHAESTFRRLTLREEVMQDGRIGAVQAADQFLAICTEYPDALKSLRTCLPGNTDRARAAGQIVAYVEARQGDDHRASPEFIASVRKELQDLLPTTP
jgi:hypothetical protein